MAKSGGIPAPAVRRLSLYLRQLEMLVAQDKSTVSSRQLGEALGLTDAQVRKDFAYFGQFGHPGIGYRVQELIVRIRKILGTDKNWNVLLVGVGNLGRALISYRGFTKKSFHLVAVFDNDPELIGTTLDAATDLRVLPTEDMAETVRALNIRLGILAVPAEHAQRVADEMRSSGIRGILNFAPVALRQDDCVVAAVDLSVHLEQLTFMLASGEAKP
jgi:redox-sensing transcriptional repressor